MDLWVRVEGRIYWADVMVTECASPAHVEEAAKKLKEGAAAEKGEARKEDKWRVLAAAEGVSTVPLVMESTGRRGKRLEEFLHDLEADSADRGPDNRLPRCIYNSR